MSNSGARERCVWSEHGWCGEMADRIPTLCYAVVHMHTRRGGILEVQCLGVDHTLLLILGSIHHPKESMHDRTRAECSQKYQTLLK